MVIKLSPLVHIEIVVRDVEKAIEFLNRVFGAEKTEIEMARFLSSSGVTKTVHVKVSNVILQFIEPITKGSIWDEFLKTKGPGVHNLTFVVNDMKEAVEALEQEGIKKILEMPFDWPKLWGSKYVRPDVAPVTMMGGDNIVGFRFELAEMPFKKK